MLEYEQNFLYENLKTSEIGKLAFEILFKNSPSLFKYYTNFQLEKCKEDINYHTRVLLESIELASPILFSDYFSWVVELFFSLGIPIDSFIQSLDAIADSFGIIAGSKKRDIVKQYINYAISLFERNMLVEKETRKNNPLKSVEEHFLKYLLDADRNSAIELIQKILDDGYSIKDIYIHVFQEALYEIGTLWQNGVITVAHEHFLTASIQFVLTHFYGEIFKNRKKHNGYTIVGCCVEGELHELGVRMLCDLLELEGFDTYYLGSNTPTKDLIQFAKSKNADAVLFSTTLTTNLSKTKNTINIMREDADIRKLKTKIIVGGRPFYVDPTLWQKVGADSCGKSYEDVMKLLL